ncbi:MAG: glycosyltransferase family 9 protein [Candidatus Zixiibacteriota bacterium]
MTRALLVRSDAVGDLALTLPVARSIKQANPDMQLALLTSRYTAPMLAGEGYIDDIVTIPNRALSNMKEITALARDLGRMKVDTCVMFYPRLSLALAVYLAKIPVRIGTARRAYSMLFNRRVNLHRRNSGKHELDLNYDLVESSFPGLSRFEPSLTVTASEADRAEAFLAEVGIDRDSRFIIVHPLSHGSSPNWRIEKYVELVEKLAGDGHRIVITGSQLEADDLARAFGSSGAFVINIAGKTDLALLKAIIHKATLLVSGSTGPIHLAGAVGTFAVGIYPPESALSPVRWGPRGYANKLFLPAVNEYKGSSVDLMDMIAVQEVYEFIMAQLSEKKNRKIGRE